MSLVFNEVFERTMGHEAGYVNDPEDPGGETKWGISKRSYPSVNIKDLTREQAADIYYADFWVPLGTKLAVGGKEPVVFQVFDAAVNHGMGNAMRFLQRAVGVADDGVWGSQSQGTYDTMDQNDVLLRFLAERLEFMTKLKKWDRFGRGWARRIAGNLKYGAEDN